MLPLTVLILSIALFIYTFIISLDNEGTEYNKVKVNTPTDYDGMGTFSRYIGK